MTIIVYNIKKGEYSVLRHGQKTYKTRNHSEVEQIAVDENVDQKNFKRI